MTFCSSQLTYWLHDQVVWIVFSSSHWLKLHFQEMRSFESELCGRAALWKLNHLFRVLGSLSICNYACGGDLFSFLPLPSSHICFTQAALLKHSAPAYLSESWFLRSYLPHEFPDLWVEQTFCCRFTFNAKTMLSSSDCFLVLMYF